MEFQDIVMKRYATKLFDGRKLPDDKVDKLLEIIRNAPSSFNIQPWKIIVITEQKLKEKLLPVSWNQPQITSCSHLLVFCANTDIAGNINELEKEMIRSGAKPEYIKGRIKILQDFEKGMTDEEKLSWAHRQVYLALGNALNGAKALGFDSCPMEGFNSGEFSKILNLPKNLVPSVLCAIGYAKDAPKEKFRFSKKDVFIEDSKLKWQK